MNISAVPTLDYGHLAIQGKINGKNEIYLDGAKLGNSASPIELELERNKSFIKLNPRNMSNSTLDISGKLRIADDLMKQFSIIKLKLPDEIKDPKTGFYPLKIKGTFSNPAIN